MFVVSYDLYLDHAATIVVPVGKCPQCGNAADISLDFMLRRVGCFMLELSMPYLPIGVAHCASCRAEIQKKHWPQEVKSVFDREKGRYRGKFKLRFSKFFKIGMLILVLVLGGMSLFEKATMPIEFVESDDKYIEESLDNMQPGMIMAISSSVNGKYYRMPVLVERIENGLIYARPYKGPSQDYDVFFMKNELDLSEANFSPKANLVLQRSREKRFLIMKEVNGAPAPQFTPNAMVHRVYGKK